MRLASLMVLLLLPGMALAVSDTITVRSAGKILQASEASLAQMLEQSIAQQVSKPVAESTNSPGVQASRSQAQHPQSSLFELFDVWVELEGDLDADGYYHHIKVNFDADVLDDSKETVYAKIYLDEYDGHWFQIATTDLFEIVSDSPHDAYQNLTELVEGFPPSDYRVLIELHSLSHPDMITTKVISLDHKGYLITLEDQQYDRPAYYDSSYDSLEVGVGVSGGVSLAGLLGGLLLLVFRPRVLRTNKIPRNHAC